MKKFFASILTLLIVVFTVAGCGGSSTSAPTYTAAKDGEWMEIQSITYYTSSQTYTFTSTVFVETTNREKITKEEYESVTESQIIPSIMRRIDMVFSTDRKSDLTDLKNSINKTLYTSCVLDISYVYKLTIKSYKTRYVKIRFINSDAFEINYFSKENDNNEDTYATERIKALSYKITYFND